jgi:copper(I)-binding protein
MRRFALCSRTVAAFLLVFSVSFAARAMAAAEDIHLASAQARPTTPGVAGVVYIVITNHGVADDTLTAVATPAADTASMHQTSNENGIMKMTPVTALPVPANSTVSFKPGGLHIMLEGLKQPLKLGDSFPITLTFKNAGPVTTTVNVARIGSAQEHDMGSMPGMKM